ncbi:MAG: glycosyltransferase [Candidatus Wallbacteria bacterium]|nr:glycosyltransferase [Candidatus Wallbacteria bacterium]
MTRKTFASESLALLVPARDDEATLETVVRETRAAALELAARVETIVVDDGSRDGTAACAERLAAELPGTVAIRHLRRRGIGRALSTAVAWARSGLLLYVPAGGRFDPATLPALLEASRRGQIALGRAGGPPRGVWARLWNWMAGVLLPEPLEDAGWVYLWRREVFGGPQVSSTTRAFFVEMLARSMRRGMRVVAVDCPPRAGAPASGIEGGLGSRLIPVVELARCWESFRREDLEESLDLPAPEAPPLRQFWWPGRKRERAARIAGAGRPSLERLDVGPDLRPPWLDMTEPLLVPMGAGLELPPAGVEVLASVRDRPAVVRQDGKIRFLFDAEQSARWRLEEAYVKPPGPAARLAVELSRLLPGKLRLGLEGAIAAFRPPPAGSAVWPIEPSVEWLRWAMLHVAGSQGEDRSPTAPWPGGKTWALAITHEVEGDEGVSNARAVADVDSRIGVRACWYVPGDVLRRVPELAGRLRECDWEIGLLGDRFDPSLAFARGAEIERRLLSCEDLLAAHQIRGFRSPGLSASAALTAAAARMFEHDCSVPDTDVAALAGACRGAGTLFPFSRGGRAVSLPITLPTDHRLIVLGHPPRDALGIWRQKVEFIRRVGGLALLSLSAEPHLGGAPEMLAVYGELLEPLVREGDVWLATPSELAAWWPGRGAATGPG